MKENAEFYLFRPFADLCSGWKQETFKQIIVQLTKRNTSPIPMIFDSPQQMSCLSNKHDSIKLIFNYLNYLKLDRIDTFEIIAVILLSIDGDFSSFIRNVIFLFGFSDSENQTSITKEEFHFFLDNLFRGVMSLGCPPEQIHNFNERKRYRLG